MTDDAIDAWHSGAYLETIRPSTYELVIQSCYGLEGQLMVCNPDPYHSCPPVYICTEAMRLHVDPDLAALQANYIQYYENIPVRQPHDVSRDVVARLAKWGLEVIQRDRWLMNSNEVAFEAIVHYLDLCRPVWQG